MIYQHHGNLTINNSTITTTTQKSDGGIFNAWGTIKVNNSTIVGNTYGINNYVYVGLVTLNNSIVAQNNVDCQGPITSAGYNLIGNTQSCTFTKSTGDLTNVNAKLGQMTGFPGYIPLLPGSPALNTGGASTCLPTDQRGLQRPQGSRCDIGSYEYKVPGAASVLGILGGNYQTSLSGDRFGSPLKAYVVDQFGSPVQGVKVTFTLPSSGASAKFGSKLTASVTTDINGIATAPTLTANHQPGSYTVRVAASGLSHSPSTLDLTNLPVPLAISPATTTSVPKPTYTWTKVIGATQYQLELRTDSWDIVYTKAFPASVCGATTCSGISPYPLDLTSYPSYYQWRVRAMVGSTWQAFSPYKVFRQYIRPGFWAGNGIEFYVTPDYKYVANPTVYLNVTGCGLYKLTSTKSVALNFSSQFVIYNSPAFNTGGAFNTISMAYGSTYFYLVEIPNCGYVEGSFDWIAYWVNNSSSATDIQPITVTPSAKPKQTHLPDDTLKVEPYIP
jgi:hypothetical protein